MHIYTYKSIYKKRRGMENAARPALSRNVVPRGKLKIKEYREQKLYDRNCEKSREYNRIHVGHMDSLLSE